MYFGLYAGLLGLGGRNGPVRGRGGGDVPLGKAGLALPVLKEEEANLGGRMGGRGLRPRREVAEGLISGNRRDAAERGGDGRDDEGLGVCAELPKIANKPTETVPPSVRIAEFEETEESLRGRSSGVLFRATRPRGRRSHHLSVIRMFAFADAASSVEGG